MTNTYQPLFTPTHVAWLASALRDALNQQRLMTDRMVIREACESIAESLQGDDPSFDKTAWLESIFTAPRDEKTHLDTLAEIYDHPTFKEINR